MMMKMILFKTTLWKPQILYMLSRHKNAGQNRNIKIADKFFENVAQFKYLATTVTNQNLIREEIKNRLNSGNACYHSVQNLLSSSLLSKNNKLECTKLQFCLWFCMGVQLRLWH
jgi:hypothetical protein